MLRIPAIVASATAIALALVTATAPAKAQTAEETAAAALEAAPVWDGHNDVPIQLRARFDNEIGDFDFADTTGTGADHAEGRVMHTDLARLGEGQVGAQFWSVYVSAALTEPQAVLATLEQIDVTRRLIDRNSGRLALALTANDVETALAEGKIASLLGMEGGHSIGSSLAVLRQMYDLGARYMTLTHSKNTPWADSATDTPEHGGLTDLGRDMVREMNRIGMLVDLSHVSEKTMLDVFDVVQAPVIYSHSGARAINGHARNVPDNALRRLKDNGGIVMVVALPGFLSEDARQWYANRTAEKARLDALFQGQPREVEKRIAVWEQDNPEPQATIADMANHIDHIRTVSGIDHIGIGGDYDGMRTGPVGMEDVTGYPALFTELARRGYSQADLEKISMRNMMRVMRKAEAVAAAQSALPPYENPAAEF
ncbi:Membrane dipeptidase [Alteripontixanthobacter maritimus]|uniref:Membrane dipeptidase n=1 Tax=Alteripontixanthobacter maritimus TaxID=2161824 RepID=A0A369QBQ9_9SPHN|nr:dipeptidase [Alteripontixanthobacter maritimus]RDC60677.1 Membrane dipeptidase [Alteripontixanthobacter maritimus]